MMVCNWILIYTQWEVLMDRISSQIRRENWRRIVQECNNREPGITKKEWCRSNDISVKSLYYWQRQFRNEAAVAAAASDGAASFYDITSHLEAGGTESFPVSNLREAPAGTAVQETAPQDIPGIVPFPVPGIIVQTGECRIYVTDSAKRSTFRMVMEVLRNA